jgi:hypothetical protein
MSSLTLNTQSQHRGSGNKHGGLGTGDTEKASLCHSIVLFYIVKFLVIVSVLVNF